MVTVGRQMTHLMFLEVVIFKGNLFHCLLVLRFFSLHNLSSLLLKLLLCKCESPPRSIPNYTFLGALKPSICLTA